MRRFLALATLALAACSDTGRHAGLTYYFTYDPRSLDPALSTDVPTGEVVTLLFDNLTQFTPDGGLEPGLASRWETDASGLGYTFHLRAGPTFHDGRPIRAPEVRQALLRALDPAVKGGRPWPLYPIAGAQAYAAGTAKDVAGIRVLDDSTIAFRLTEPLNIFPKLLAMPVAAIVPTPVPDGFDQHPVGSGPWRLVSWAHDDALVLARNEAYWGGAPATDTLRIRIIPEALTEAAEYESGRLSVVEIPFGETRRWEEQHGAEVQRRPALRAVYVALNTTRGPLRDARVRQALNHAVDVRSILATVVQGRGVLAAGAIPPGLAGYDSSRTPYAYDAALARQLLSAAGYGPGLKLTLWRTQRSDFARIAQAIQEDLAQIGVTVEIVERDAATARAAARKGEADLFLTDWWADYPDGENFTYPLFFSANQGTGGNLAFYADSALDRLILRARSTGNEAEKAALLRQVDQRVFDAAPWIFCWFPMDLWAMRPEVTGWEIPAIFTGQRWRTVRVTP